MQQIEDKLYKCDYCGNTSVSSGSIKRCEVVCHNSLIYQSQGFSDYYFGNRIKYLGYIPNSNYKDVYMIRHDNDRKTLIRLVFYLLSEFSENNSMYFNLNPRYHMSNFFKELNRRNDIEDMDYIVVSLGGEFTEREVMYNFSILTPQEWNDDINRITKYLSTCKIDTEDIA